MTVTKNDIADTITFEDAKNYVNALAAEILDDVKANRIQYSAIQYADDKFLSEEDIVDAITARNITLLDCDLEIVTEMRAEVLEQLKDDIEVFLNGNS